MKGIQLCNVRFERIRLNTRLTLAERMRVVGQVRPLERLARAASA